MAARPRAARPAGRKCRSRGSGRLKVRAQAATPAARARTAHGGSRPRRAEPRWRQLSGCPRHHPIASSTAERVRPVAGRVAGDLLPDDDPLAGVQPAAAWTGRGRYGLVCRRTRMLMPTRGHQRVAEAPGQRPGRARRNGERAGPPDLECVRALEMHAVEQGVAGSRPGEVTAQASITRSVSRSIPSDRPSRIAITAIPTPRLRAMAPLEVR